MRFWFPLMFEPPEQVVEIARICEACGFEGIGMADHLLVPDDYASVHPSGGNPFLFNTEMLDTFTTVAALATATTTLRFMSFVYVVPLREPFSIAKQVGTAAILSGYRVALGAGAGWLAEEFAVVGRDMATRGRRMDEALSVIRDFWDDGWAEGDGEFFPFPRSSMHPVPERPIPVWIGGSSEAALRRAVRQDGWLGMGYPLAEVHRLLDRLHVLRAEAGDDRADFEIMAGATDADGSLDGYRALEARGVTSTIGTPFMPGDPAYRDLEVKRAALERYGEEVIAPLRS